MVESVEEAGIVAPAEGPLLYVQGTVTVWTTVTVVWGPAEGAGAGATDAPTGAALVGRAGDPLGPAVMVDEMPVTSTGLADT